eukprot:Nitzschia sp. Nitz4//scaffold298_size22859//1636//3244//NITZ4_008526-RA/size22859-processed-gene-0.13-mRNA-1//-1//CDS//3329546314//890//frame0
MTSRFSILWLPFLAVSLSLTHTLALSGVASSSTLTFQPLQGTTGSKHGLQPTKKTFAAVSSMDRFISLRGGEDVVVNATEEEDQEEEDVSEDADLEETKEVIVDALKEKDSAQMLADAIRERASMLKDDPLLWSIDRSVASVGQALGSADIDKDAGGVPASTSAVIANYFLKSHGGSHGMQSAASSLAATSAIGAILARRNPTLAFNLLWRTFFFAMIKHVSGMMASATIAAQAIPKIGLSQARLWMKQLAKDPVSQYVFFNALMITWLPHKVRIMFDQSWWWKRATTGGPWILLSLVAPVMVRECISILLVLSDILVLWSATEDNPALASVVDTVLQGSQSVVNAVMSLLVSPDTWRKSDASQRQAILSKLVGQVSLASEVAIGVLMILDALFSVLGSIFVTGQRRPTFAESLIRLICVRLYIHFLWTRRTSIQDLVATGRAMTSKLPLQMLDAILEPAKAMGIQLGATKTDPNEMSWRDYVTIGLGLQGTSSSATKC